jgi:multimeric flavodoxin WrbA
VIPPDERRSGCHREEVENADIIVTADGIIVGSPVYYASPNSALMALLDRALYASGDRFADKSAAVIVSCRRGGAATAFDVLNKHLLYLICRWCRPNTGTRCMATRRRKCGRIWRTCR